MEKGGRKEGQQKGGGRGRKGQEERGQERVVVVHVGVHGWLVVVVHIHVHGWLLVVMCVRGQLVVTVHIGGCGQLLVVHVSICGWLVVVCTFVFGGGRWSLWVVDGRFGWPCHLLCAHCVCGHWYSWVLTGDRCGWWSVCVIVERWWSGAVIVVCRLSMVVVRRKEATSHIVTMASHLKICVRSHVNDLMCNDLT